MGISYYAPDQSDAVYLTPADNLQAAIEASPEGRTFVLRSGVYENVTIAPKSGQSIIGENGAVLDGAIDITGWTNANGVWSASGYPSPAYSHGEGRNGMAQYVEDLLVDGTPYLRVGSLAELRPGAFYYQDGKVYISDNPTGKHTEALSTTTAINGGTTHGVTIANLTLEHYASMAQHGAIEAQGTQGWNLVDVSAIGNHGAGVAAGDGTHITRGVFSGNGQVGIHAQDTTGLVIDGVTAVGNNYAGFSETWDAGGIKILTSENVTVQNSAISDNSGFGLWLDWDNRNANISGNWIHDNGRSGLFYEASYDAAIAGNNVSYNNKGGYTAGYWGADIIATSSSNLTISGNYVVSDIGQGIGIQQDARQPGVYGAHTSWNDIVTGNTIVMLTAGANGFASDSQNGTYGNNHWDGNTYIADTAKSLFFTWDNLWLWAADRNQLPIEKTGTFIYTATPAELVKTGFLDGVQAGPASGAVAGTGAHQLVLKISQDAWQGDAQYTVSVDGVQVGGTFIAAAAHASGRSDTLTLQGDWAPGAHNVAVSFLNDAYGGTPATDRNLYVDGTSYDGNAVPSGNLVLQGVGSGDFHFL